MKIKKKYRFVDIQIDDFGKLTDVTFLVDKTDFIDEIEEVRKKFNLNYDYPLSDSDSEKVSNNFDYKLQYKDKELKEKFDKEVEEIRKLFRMPPHFREVIEVSILYGRVKDHNYSKAYLEKQEITPIKSPDEIPDIKYCIVIHSGTRLEDIKKTFDEFKKEVWINFKASEKEKRKYHFGYWFDFSLTKPLDTKDSIKDLSNFYRLRKNGVSPLDIALKDLRITKKDYKGMLGKCRAYEKNNQPEKEPEYIKNMALIDAIIKRRNSIKSVIKRYSDFLTTPNTIL